MNEEIKPNLSLPDLAFLEPFKTEPCGRPDCIYCDYEKPMWHSIYAKLNTEQAAFLDSFETQAAYNYMDASWASSVFAGDWPNSVEMLEVSLKRAKEFLTLTEEEQTEYYKLTDPEKKEFYEKRFKEKPLPGTIQNPIPCVAVNTFEMH